MKWVLVRSRLGTLYVLRRGEWEVFNAQYERLGEVKAELVMESTDRDELVRFQMLTKES